MSEYRLERIDDDAFSVLHAVYATENIFLSCDWSERLEDSRPDRCGYLLQKDGVAIGGAICEGDRIRSPFLIPPFQNLQEYWSALLRLRAVSGGELHLDFIPDTHAEALRNLGAVKTRGQHRMMRPTSRTQPSLDDAFSFDEISGAESDDIFSVIYRAHYHGFTSTVYGKPDLLEIKAQTERRIQWFSETRTLHFSTLVRRKEDNRIAAVCIAGIYPGSANRFSTIHQVSVLPECRRRGLARAMMLESIGKAHASSPVVTLGVLSGNPAMRLYSDLGFVAGCEYGDYVIQC